MSKTHLQKGHIQCTVLLCKKERVDHIFSFKFFMKLYVKILRVYLTKKFNTFDNSNKHLK